MQTMPLMESQYIIHLQKWPRTSVDARKSIASHACTSKCLGLCPGNLHAQNTKNSVSTPMYCPPTDGSFQLGLYVYS